jgi:glycosyltransferase involved in cell wall biosynthesis
MPIPRTIRSLARKSPRVILQHAVRRWAQRLDVSQLDFVLLERDIADSRTLHTSSEAPAGSTTNGRRLGWIVVPPGAGSGGHTTLFRMMAAATAAGFDNTLLFYDRYRGDIEGQIATVRAAWPWLQCEIAAVGDTLAGFDAIVASSWQTAHAAACRRVPGQPVIYFIQDFEPYFYPRGSEYALAEDSYRLGHRNVALGAMVRDCLLTEVSLTPETVPFGCDTTVYRALRPERERSGVVFYAKRGNERRGHRLAVLALTEFHRRHPDEPIHVYGDDPGHLPFPVVTHGSLPPTRLNELYNSAVAGIALSFTNISLVAEEMLAAGVVPVVNDSPLARADLANPHTAWAGATPSAVADALSAAVSRRDRAAHARTVAASVTTAPWEQTGERFAEILVHALSPDTATVGAVTGVTS